MPVRVAILWHSVSGYMASCWRALAERPEVDSMVIVGRTNQDFADSVLQGVNAKMLPAEDLEHVSRIAPLVAAHKPDVIVVCGWFIPGYRDLAFDPAFRDVRFVMGMDTPRQGTLRQKAGRLIHRRYFARLERVVVPGERAFQLARELGFEDARISRGLYGVDVDALSPLLERRAAQPGGWPRRWLFMGRYHPVKGLDVLIPAYEAYRRRVRDPWPLSTMGSGELAGLLKGVDGVEDLGFVQPADQPAQLVRHGAFVLSSRYDPWPLVVVESCAAGLPVVCTEACGSSVELVRSCYNGVTCAPEDPEALAGAMGWLHERAEQLPEFGRRSTQMGAAFGARVWAERWVNILARSR